jgi:dienelactone hydrolase
MERRWWWKMSRRQAAGVVGLARVVGLAAVWWLAAVCLAAQTGDVAGRAREAAEMLVRGEYEALAERFSAEMKKAAPPEMLRKAAGGQLAALGAFQKTGEVEVSKAGAFTVAVVAVEMERGAVRVQVSFNAAGEIAGLFLRPAAAAWTRPSYSVPEKWVEREVTVGTAEWPLPGVLVMPRGEGPFPALVLVHGSGPNDKDETVGAAKPFRDLAEGLASCGVAVLRYEKRTRHYGAKLAEAKTITVREEVIEDALEAVRLLRKTPGVDGKRVFVLGHSLGGWAAPLIAAEDGGLAGVFLMAAPARPLEDLMVEQLRYLLPMQVGEAEAQKRLAEVEKEAAAVRRIREAGEGPEKALGAPRSYWLSLRGLDPLAAAARLSVPVWVLQGGRDYQVTETDFRLWEKALAGRAGAVLKLYPRLNHLMQSGEGKSRPEEYQRPGHVAGEVIEDLCRWVKGAQ